MSDDETPEVERPAAGDSHPQDVVSGSASSASEAAGVSAGPRSGSAPAATVPDEEATAPRRAASGTATGDTAVRPRRGRGGTGSRIRQVLLALVIGILVVLLGITISTYLHARHVISNIPRNTALMPTGKRTSVPDGALNFLILGADTRDYDPSDPGRSDTMMLAHVPKDRKHVYLVSITRDTWVPIHNRGYAKINAAYEQGGAPLTVETVEDFLGITIDHVALMDFQGFMKMTDVLGGVQVWNEQEFSDSADMGCVFPQGFVTVKGDCGLAFVRERKQSPNNDLGRAQRQRDVVKAIAQKALSAGVLANPVTANKMMDQIGNTFTLDSQWTDDDLMKFATSLKIGSSEDIRSLQIPVGGYDVSDDGQDINVPDTEQLAEIAYGLRTDTMDQWWATHDPSATTQVTNNPAWPEGDAPEGTPSPRPTVPTPTATPTATITPTGKKSSK